MKEIFEKVKIFFTNDLVDFVKSNWITLAVAGGIILLLLVSLIITGALKKKYKRKNKELTEDNSVLKLKVYDHNLLIQKDATDKAQLKNQIEVLIEENKVLSEKVESDVEKISALELEKASANKLIGDLTNELESLRSSLSNSEMSYDVLKSDFDALNKELTSVKVEYDDLKDKYDEAIEENDRLKSFELENKILLKTLRTFMDSDAETHDLLKDSINNLSEKVDSLVKLSKEKHVCSCKEKSDNSTSPVLSSMKRKELSALAKSLGIENFATWTNKRLIAEIRSKQK